MTNRYITNSHEIVGEDRPVCGLCKPSGPKGDVIHDVLEIDDRGHEKRLSFVRCEKHRGQIYGG